MNVGDEVDAVVIGIEDVGEGMSVARWGGIVREDGEIVREGVATEQDDAGDDAGDAAGDVERNDAGRAD